MPTNPHTLPPAHCARTSLLTADGTYIDLYRPDPVLVRPFDVCWSLSQTNRFLGRCMRPYSVAEHSILVAEIARRDLGLDVHGQLAALMHDAHEAYIGDLSSPLKRVLGRDWGHTEHQFERLVRTALALHTATTVHAQAIRQADLIALATERRDLLPFTVEAWPDLEGIEPVTWVNLRSAERRAATWEDWRDRMLDAYHALDFGRNVAMWPSAERQKASPQARAANESSQHEGA